MAFSAISVAFNVVHAAPTLVARLVAAIPPAALVLSFELLMRQLRAALRQRAQVTAIEPLSAVILSPVTPKLAHDRTSSAPGSPLLEQARETCATRQHTSSRVTGAVLARELGISDGYARRLLRQLATDSGGT